jgi:hypothetical protein
VVVASGITEKGVQVVTHRRIAVLISVAAVATAGLGTGIVIAAGGSGSQAPATENSCLQILRSRQQSALATLSARLVQLILPEKK